MKKLNLRYPLIVLSMAAAGMYAGCDLEELCGNDVEDVGECDYLTGEHSCAADCTGGGDGGDEGGEGEGEASDGGEGEGEGEGMNTECTADEKTCSEDGLSLIGCTADGMWDEGTACDAGKHCISGDNIEAQCDWIRDSYKWVRVCSTSYRRGNEYREKSPGPDIDAIELIKADGTVIAASQAGTSNLQGGANEFGDTLECLGSPDATDSNHANGCGGFTSIGLKGHFLTVGFEADVVIEPGDKIVVYEVPNCSLDQDNVRTEPSRIDVSVLSEDGLWYEVASDFAGGTSPEFEVMADPGVSESQDCEPCDPNDDTDGGCMP